MAKNKNNRSSDWFGNLFDFNGDGKTDMSELWIAHNIYEECTKGKNTLVAHSPLHLASDIALPKPDWHEDCDDGSECDLYPEDFDTKDEYDEALKEARYSWRELCTDGSEYGLDPKDFETEDEYEDALEEAKTEENQWAQADDEDEIPIYPEDYLNKRKYNAAYTLHCIENGEYNYILPKDKDRLTARCRFILDSNNILAANYLTCDGEFLYGQAIKDHFSIPIELEDEDEESTNDLEQIITEIAAVDPKLALKIWIWCIAQFYPYRQHEAYEAYSVKCVLSVLDEMPEEFIEELLNHLSASDFLMQAFTGIRYFSYPAVCFLIYHLLQIPDVSAAQRLLITYLQGPVAFVEDIKNIVSTLISECASDDENGSMILFRDHILPIIAMVDKVGVKKAKNGWKKRIDAYLS